MKTLEQYLDDQLAGGRLYFTKNEAMSALGITADAFKSASARLMKKDRLISPWRGFYLILRPEDRSSGAPDPVLWIDLLMKYLKLDYRISLLRAAAFHGSSHQVAMVIQVMVSKQIRDFELGRHRIQFIYLRPSAFSKTNQPDWLQQLKSETGYAKVAGIELTLLDSARYFHKAGGINSVAQVVHDLGDKADVRKLVKAADCYENSSVRRLGYLLQHFGHDKQAKALLPFVKKAKSMKDLDPSVTPISEDLPCMSEPDSVWMLRVNTSVEIDE